MKKLLLISASSGENLKLVEKISEIARGEFNCEIIDLTQISLPLYSPRQEEGGVPAEAINLATRIKEADALFVTSPEYNGSIAPTLNNMIAWVSRSSKNWRESFNEKATVIGTHSGGGGSYVLMAMRQQLSYVGCNVLGRVVHTNYNKTLNEESLLSILQQIQKYI